MVTNIIISDWKNSANTRKLQETDLTTYTRTCTGAKLTLTGTGSNDTTELQTR